jgi:hypothetical protein
MENRETKSKAIPPTPVPKCFAQGPESLTDILAVTSTDAMRKLPTMCRGVDIQQCFEGNAVSIFKAKECYCTLCPGMGLAVSAHKKAQTPESATPLSTEAKEG